MHYLYRHIRLDEDEPFYIGIGIAYKQDINSKNTRSAIVNFYNNDGSYNSTL